MSFLHTHKTRLARGVWEANIVLSLQAVGRHHWLGVAGDVTAITIPLRGRRAPEKPAHHSATPPLHHRQGGGRDGRQPGKWGWGDTREGPKGTKLSQNEVTIGRFRAHHGCPWRVVHWTWCCPKRRVHVWDETFISPRYCSWALSESVQNPATPSTELWNLSHATQMFLAGETSGGK